MTRVKVLVMSGYGINCEHETRAAWAGAGADATIAHANSLFDGTARLGDHDVLTLPGGFSFGDDLGAGKVLANRLKHRRLPSGEPFRAEIERFLDRGGFILGICNGFQVLVKMGLLPNTDGRMEQEVTLFKNDSGRFEDRWCECVVPAGSRCGALDGAGRVRLPVRHGEGKLIVRDDGVRERIASQGLVCLAYAEAGGAPTGRYPDNPNGSEFACAGLTDPSGRVLGMMPHPEAHLSLFNDPAWPSMVRRGRTDQTGEGLHLFTRIVRHLTDRRSRS